MLIGARGRRRKNIDRTDGKWERNEKGFVR
jgi:hypothetical protein